MKIIFYILQELKKPYKRENKQRIKIFFRADPQQDSLVGSTPIEFIASKCNHKCQKYSKQVLQEMKRMLALQI